MGRDTLPRQQDNVVIAQETALFLGVFVPADCHNHYPLQPKRTREIAKGRQFLHAGNTGQNFSMSRLPPNAVVVICLP